MLCLTNPELRIQLRGVSIKYHALSMCRFWGGDGLPSFFFFFFRLYPQDQIQAIPDMPKSFPAAAQDDPGGLALRSSSQ